MRVVEVDAKFNEDESEMIGFILEDGTLITVYVGCDWKENPARLLIKLTKKVKEGDEIVQMFDGSDTLWYGIIRAKVSKSKASRKLK